MTLTKRIILLLLLALVPVLTITPITSYFLIRSSNRIIAEWAQPSSIHYDSVAPYRLIVTERNTDWSDFPYREKTFQIYVGNDFPYGDWYRFPFYYHEDGVESMIKNSSVEWTKEGVTFKAISGESLFIPKSIIVGGRS
jgi:hypothetical protein